MDSLFKSLLSLVQWKRAYSLSTTKGALFSSQITPSPFSQGVLATFNPCEIEVENDTESQAEIERVLKSQAEAIAQCLQRYKLLGRTITVKVKLNEALGQGRYREVSRSRTLADGTQSAAVIFQEACQLFVAVPLDGHKVRLVGVQVSMLTPVDSVQQLALFSENV
jgi:nucleotidyltransferase/DNA polymerase involved in DNA repair